MLRQPYYPRLMGERAEWYTNFATKLPGCAVDLTLTQAEEDNGAADNLTLACGLGGWIIAVRKHSTACTSSLDTLSYSPGSTNHDQTQQQELIGKVNELINALK